MNMQFLTHWLFGILSTAIWFWGAKVGIPAAGIDLAASIVPGLLGHAVATINAGTSSAAPAAVVGSVIPAPSSVPASQNPIATVVNTLL